MRWLFALACVMGCVDAPLGLSEECARTSQCDTPLVCRLQHCRTECADNRDCPVGAICVLDEAGLGACRLPPEATCGSDGDCPGNLVCRSNECANACSSDGDCAPGSSCLGEDGAECVADARCGCLQQAEQCTSSAECPPGFVCDAEGTCRAECRSSRDCRFGATCVSGTCTPADAAIDAGPTLDSTVDTSSDASVPGESLGLFASFSYTCEVIDAELQCWGRMPASDAQVAPTSLVDLVSDVSGSSVDRILSPGVGHLCFVRGGAYCFGYNAFGQLGNGSMSPMADPPEATITRVVGLPDRVQQVAAAARHTCALAEGRVYCWGTAMQGELGNGSDMGSFPTPVELSLADVVQIGAADETTCALNREGEVSCWGVTLGVAGAATSSPTPIDLPRTRRIDLSSGAACAIDETETARCWGILAEGVFAEPQMIEGLSVRQVALGGFLGIRTTCALLSSGEMTCWGTGRTGLLGDGSYDDRLTPGTRVLDPSGVRPLTGVTRIAMSAGHACAATDTGTYCWGGNDRGQLGDRSRTTTAIPVQVVR